MSDPFMVLLLKISTLLVVGSVTAMFVGVAVLVIEGVRRIVKTKNW